MGAVAESVEWLAKLPHWHCFGCDPKHPKGLHLGFDAVGPDHIRCEVTLTGDYVGAESIVHGGIITTVFDDAMMWCLLRFRHRFYLTAHMEQRFRRPTPAGVPLIAEAVIEEDLSDGRVRLNTRLYATQDPNTTLAEGSGVFVEAPPRMLDLMSADQRSEIEDLVHSFAVADA